jgi:hypothetical protein
MNTLTRRGQRQSRGRPRDFGLAAFAQGIRLALVAGVPAPCRQARSLTGVMMSGVENSVANCSGVPNKASIRSVYLAR